LRARLGGGSLTLPRGLAIAALQFGAALVGAFAGDQAQFGQAWSRNMVSGERGLPESFDPKTGVNVRWTAPLGTESYSTPVVARGRVLIGTNNGEPRDARRQGDRGVLMCFDEKDGRLLWQLVVPKREEDPYFDWPKSGISSPATVEGDRVYLVDNRGTVLCLDLDGLANGNDGPFRDEAGYLTPRTTNGPGQLPPTLDSAPPPRLEPGPLDADILWTFDLTSGAGVWSHDAAHSSILIQGDYLYLNTGTGVDNTHKVIRTPDAPSLVVLDKRTGRLLARDDEHIAPRIFHCTWSSPSLGTVDGRELVFFAGGDGVLYAFEPLKSAPADGEVAQLHKVWQFDFDPTAPKDDPHQYLNNRAVGPSNMYGMPVLQDGLIYVAGGGDWFWGKNQAWLKCVDPRGSGDLTRTGLRWEYPLGRHTMSTPAVAGGIAFVADSMHLLHCVDAQTGQALWTHELGGEVWASPLVADGKVYVGTRRGDFWVFAAAREKRWLSTVQLDGPISATPVAAGGTVYVGTQTRLYAFAEGATAPRTAATRAGTGDSGWSGDGASALAAAVGDPFGIVRGPDGAIWFCDYRNHVIRRIAPEGTISTVVGNGQPGYAGDGGPAKQASLNQPHELRFDRDGNLFIADMSNHAIRRVDAQTHVITTFAGTGLSGYSGDGEAATKARFNQPISLQFSPAGDLFVCDIGNNVIRRVDAKSGTISTFAGTGHRGATPDGASLAGAPLNGPRSLDFDRAGNLWLATREGNQVFRFDLAQGVIHHVAGTGQPGFSGNGGPAKEATLSGPKGIAVAPNGDVYLADTEARWNWWLEQAQRATDRKATRGNAN
jgi:outer membrane protein assembly factor BamB/sugar lactone lactonase YvrE